MANRERQVELTVDQMYQEDLLQWDYAKSDIPNYRDRAETMRRSWGDHQPQDVTGHLSMAGTTYKA